MFSVSFRYKGDKKYRPYAQGLDPLQLTSAVSYLALLAEVRDIRIDEKISPLKYYQI